MRIVPQHVTIIMDGNGRWAKERSLPRLAGHKAGVEAIRRVVEAAVVNQVKFLSLFAFSTENWSRPEEEVNGLMALLAGVLETEVDKLHERNIRLKLAGEISAFSEQIQVAIEAAEELTANNTGMTLIIAANYGGRWDIAQAARQLAQAVQDGKIQADELSEELLASKLALAGLPDPDLFIRTSGELRISNFFLWQIAYSELYFTSVYWPDFDKLEFEKALTAFAERERRYGLTKSGGEE